MLENQQHLFFFLLVNNIGFRFIELKLNYFISTRIWDYREKWNTDENQDIKKDALCHNIKFTFYIYCNFKCEQSGSSPNERLLIASYLS